MAQFLRLLITSLLLCIVTSQEVRFKGNDKEFLAWLNKVYTKTQIDDKTMNRVKNYVTKRITEITDVMKRLDVCLFDFVQLRGSGEEGLKILHPDEFDFVLYNKNLKSKIVFREDQRAPGFAYAIQNEKTCLDKYKLQDPKNAIDPGLVRDHVFELVKQALKKLGIKSEIYKVGPSINFQIPSKESAFPEIDIDLVLYLKQENWPSSASILNPPSLMEPGVGLVAKVLEPPENTKLWQISFSAIEIKILKNIDDKDNGCRKKLLKIAKYLKTKTEMPKTVSSYEFKTLLLEMNNRRKDPADWTESQLVARFKEMMNTFLVKLKTGCMPSFFIPSCNKYKGKDLTEAIKKVEGLFRTIWSDPNSLLPTERAQTSSSGSSNPLKKSLKQILRIHS